MKPTLCERVAAPLLMLHGKTTPVAAVVMVGVIGVCLIAIGLALGNAHVAWAGGIVMLTGWYGFLLSGCERLLAAKEHELQAYKSISRKA